MSKRVRFIRCSYIVGWEPKDDGLLLMYSDGSRELIPMSAKDADENADFFIDELFNGRDIIGIAWDDDGVGGQNLL